MPMSPYVQRVRNRVGHDLLLLPGVTAVIRDGDKFLLARQRDSELWSLIGGGIEPGEEPADAVEREVFEELGIRPAVDRIIGAYGGPELVNTYPNGDEVAYVTVAYECHLPSDTQLVLEQDELIETAWMRADEIRGLPRHKWIDRVIAEALGDSQPSTD